MMNRINNLTNTKEKANGFVMLEAIMSGIIVLTIMLQKPGLSSIVFSASFIVLFGYALYQFRSLILKKTEALLLSIIIVSMLAVLIDAAVNGAAITFEYLKSYIMFLSTILLMYIYSSIDCNRETGIKLIKLNVAIAYLYPIAYYFFPMDNKFANLLSLNFSNPNLTGMFILQSALYSAIGVIILKKWWRAVSLIALISTTVLIYMTEARNAILALIGFAVLSIWIFIRRSKRISRLILVIVDILPAVFVPLYLAYIEVVKKNHWLDFIVDEGKSLTSRVGIWTNDFQIFGNRWLTGFYSTLPGNAHNSNLVILFSYGIITLILVMLYTYQIMQKINTNALSMKNLYCLCAFFAVLFMGIGEGALFSGGIGIYILSCGFILLGKCDFELKKV